MKVSSAFSLSDFRNRSMGPFAFLDDFPSTAFLLEDVGLEFPGEDDGNDETYDPWIAGPK